MIFFLLLNFFIFFLKLIYNNLITLQYRENDTDRSTLHAKIIITIIIIIITIIIMVIIIIIIIIIIIAQRYTKETG